VVLVVAAALPAKAVIGIKPRIITQHSKMSNSRLSVKFVFILFSSSFHKLFCVMSNKIFTPNGA